MPHHTTQLGEVTSENLSTKQTITKRAETYQKLIDHFRQRWRREYLTELRQYYQAKGDNNQTISVGDVVQVYDDHPRVRWKLAVIERLIPGNDGLVRSAVIRTKDGVTNRPIVKLYPLEVTVK